MNFKSLIAAATIAAAAPMTASAVTVFADDGTTSVGVGESVEGQFLALGQGGAGDYRHTFELADEGNGEALVTIDVDVVLPSFVGLVAQWLDAADNSNVLSSIVITDNVTTLSTTFGGSNSLNQVLQLLWTDSTKGTGFDGRITVSTVPVPAGLLLMGTALAGLGLTRRRKS
jgi:hypothetical protein